MSDNDDDAALNTAAAIIAGTGCLLLAAPTIVIGLVLIGVFIYALWP